MENSGAPNCSHNLGVEGQSLQMMGGLASSGITAAGGVDSRRSNGPGNGFEVISWIWCVLPTVFHCASCKIIHFGSLGEYEDDALKK